MWEALRTGPQLRKPLAVVHALWLLIIVASFLTNLFYERQHLKEIAVVEARTIVHRDLAFREWGASHGGVYVPISSHTPPNPYLADLPERDIFTPSGIALTLMNPAYMIRQLYEIYSDDQKTIGRITSLQPLRPENKPDAWEAAALAAATVGAGEVLEFTSIDNKPYLRVMQTLVTKASCLKCHAVQGYKEGDIRGGISLALPLEDLLASLGKATRALLFGHLLIYLTGFGGLIWGQKLFSRKIRERDRARIALEKSEEKFRTLADFTYAWEYWLDQRGELAYVSPSVETITGYTSRELTARPELLPSLVVDDQDAFLNHLRRDMEADNCEFDFQILTKGGEKRWLRHTCRPMYDRQGKFLGRRASNFDITEQKQAELDRLRLIEELKGALAQVKTLSGFLPICANCKKIRDDHGYWSQIESYITEHSDAVFSHSICPECLKNLYPDYWNKDS